MHRTALKYGLCLLFIGALAVMFLSSRDLSDLKTRYRLLCDAFTIPGVLLLCAGSLVWVSNLGALDGLAYGLRLAIRALIPRKRLEKEVSYHDFVTEKRAHPIRGYGFLLICGGISVAVSLVFLGLFLIS